MGKYNYKYDDNKRMIESETLKWNSTKEEWEKDLRINYTYEGKTVTTNYYKWNNKKRAYVLVPAPSSIPFAASGHSIIGKPIF